VDKILTVVKETCVGLIRYMTCTVTKRWAYTYKSYLSLISCQISYVDRKLCILKLSKSLFNTEKRNHLTYGHIHDSDIYIYICFLGSMCWSQRYMGLDSLLSPQCNSTIIGWKWLQSQWCAFSLENNAERKAHHHGHSKRITTNASAKE